MKKQLNLHLISDSTGETLTFISKAVLSQFPEIELKEFHHFLIKNEAGLEKAIEKIKNDKGIVLFTILNEKLEEILQKICNELEVPCIAPILPIIKEFASFLGIENMKTIGKQHEISDEYYNKMEAINYTLNHDDGNLSEDLSGADIIILGVSRSSKSPTSIYLAYKGYKVGNIPFVKAELIPKYISTLKTPLIVGFTIDPDRLQSIRQSRIKTLEVKDETDYTDIETIREEVREAKKFFSKLEIPVINVTEKSIEETSVYILNLLEEHKKNHNR
jgi:regulator of PEP synthase PpsR (kinase-PPPase family)